MNDELRPRALDIRWLWLYLAFAAMAVYPALTQPIELLAYDAAREHVPRSLVFSQAIGDGNLYPRWAQHLNWGLGSPLFTFQPPLPYYALDLLFRLGLPHPLAWRVLVAGGMLLAGLGAYLLVYALTANRWASLVAGMAYLYAPYVIRNAMERGSTEAFSMFLYPWVLWAILRLAWRPSRGRFLLATLIWAACIGSHVLAPLILAPFAGALSLVLAWRRRTLAPLLALVAGGLLTAFIWLPMVPEQAWVHVERDFSQPEAIPSQNALPLDSLLAIPVLYDSASDTNGSGDRVGLLHTALLLAGIPAAVFALRRGRRDLAGYTAVATGTGLFLFWLLTGASDPVWRNLAPILDRLLYRTRLMGLESMAAACVSGLIVALLARRWQPAAGSLLASLLILLAMPSLYVNLLYRWASHGTNMGLADVRQVETGYGLYGLTAFGEFTPRWQSEAHQESLAEEIGTEFDPAVQPLADTPSGTLVTAARISSSAWDLDFETPAPAHLALHLLYYPRWQALLDGQPVALRPQDETGYVQLNVPAGRHHLALRYGSTLAERIGLGTSALTLLVLLALAFDAFRLRRRGGNPAAQPAVRPGLVDAVPSARTAALHVYLFPVFLTALVVFKINYVDPHTGWFRCHSAQEQVCGAQAVADARFVGGPHLRGYTVSTPVAHPGDSVHLTLYWQLDRQVERPLATFVHIRNKEKDWPVNPETGSDIWAQENHPAPGGYPAVALRPGRIYADEFRVSLPEDMPEGEYLLEVGWFDLESGEQLDVEQAPAPLAILWRSVLLPPLQVR